MPQPLKHNNSKGHGERDCDDPSAEGLTSTQIQEANYLNSLVVEADPTQQFAKRATLREAYHDICSQFEGDIGENESPEISYMNSLSPSTSSTDLGLVDNPLLMDDDETTVSTTVPSSSSHSIGSSSNHPSTTASYTPTPAPRISLEQWASFGCQNHGTLTYDVTFNYQSLLARPRPQVEKKARLKSAKEFQEAAVVLSSKQLSETDEISVAQELDKVRKALKRAWKENTYVDFFSFVIDRHDFAKTVENMFYVSFLVKDGRVRLSLGDDGLPVLLRVSGEERQRLHVDDRSAAVTNQAIISFTYKMWEDMVKAMDLQSVTSSKA
ncbi:unnamed protein product [Nippostrongylus brasiliensis]|uniref:Non-structural maintenance of chromosomes element 4 n=1 Tax=Nippostrongylus brasiliensis TaxID=27835 RepID=A0A0N4XFN5_NIPBR|nr:unnamed protein product [Nippostrongylus brasiliensis]